jgi:hypothetical protein
LYLVSKPSLFTWTFLMAYSEEHFKGNGNKVTSFYFSDNSEYKMYHIFVYVDFTLLQILFKHIWNNLISWMCDPCSRLQINTSLKTSVWRWRQYVSLGTVSIPDYLVSVQKDTISMLFVMKIRSWNGGGGGGLGFGMV